MMILEAMGKIKKESRIFVAPKSSCTHKVGGQKMFVNIMTKCINIESITL